LVTTTADVTEELDIGNGVLPEQVNRFCYLGDAVNESREWDSATTARLRYVWKKLRELTYSNWKEIKT